MSDRSPWNWRANREPTQFAQDTRFTPSPKTGKSKSQTSTETLARVEKRTGLAVCGLGKSKRGIATGGQ